MKLNHTAEDYRVKDLSLAEWGSKEITVAEKEMPGLLAIREKYKAQKPLKKRCLGYWLFEKNIKPKSLLQE